MTFPLILWRRRRPKRYWPTVAGALAGVAAIHCLSLTLSPTLWMDEVQIVDLGRVFLTGPTASWSICWLPAGRPVQFLNYLGPVIQELAYRTWSAPAGPRLSSLLGALVAAGLALAWLRLRRVPWPIASGLGLAFLLDPLFVASYRGARVDSWTFSACFAACVLLRLSRRESRVWRRGLSQAVSGALMMVAFFIWPSAMFLTPIFAVELLEAELSRPRPSVGRFSASAIIVGAGGLVALALLLAPMWPNLSMFWADAHTSKNAYVSSGSLAAVLARNVRSFFASCLLSPLLPAAATLFAFLPSCRWLAVAFGLTALAMLPTEVYPNRIIYLLPAMIALIGEGMRTIRALGWSNRRLSAGAAMLALAVSWSAAVSLVARPALALSQREGRAPGKLLEASQAAFGAGPLRVYPPWELYYAGRALGWAMYRPYGAITEREWTPFLAKVDIGIARPGDDVIRHFAEAGLSSPRTLAVGVGSTSALAGLSASPWGEYAVWSRAKQGP